MGRRKCGSVAVQCLCVLLTCAAASSDDAGQQRIARLIDQLGSYAETESQAAYSELRQMPAGEVYAPLIAALTSEHWPARAGACRLLAEKGEARAVKAIIRRLTDEVWAVRVEAARSLGQLRAKDATTPLVELLGDEDPVVQEAAAQAIGQIGGPLPHELCLKLLDSGNEGLTWAALRAMAAAKEVDVRASARLVALLNHSDAKISRLAAGLLGRAAEPAAVEPLAKYMMTTKDRFGADAAGEALYRIAGPRCVEVFAPAIGHSNYVIRRWAILGLGRSRDPRALKLLAGALKDGKPWRRTIPYVLTGFAGYDMLPPLVEALRTDGNADVRESAAEALGCIGHPAAVEPLIATVRDMTVTEGVRWHAVEALGRVGGDEALAAVVAAMKSSETRVRHSAVYACQLARDKRALDAVHTTLTDEVHVIVLASVLALERMPDRRSVEPLIRAVRLRCGASAATDEQTGRSYSHVRSVAARTLGEIGDRRAVPVLLELLGDGDPAVVHRAAEALGKIGDRRAAEPLMKVLEHPSQEAREAAAVALIRLGADRAGKPVLKALRDTPSWRNRWACTQGLDGIADRSLVGPLLETLTAAGPRPTSTAPAALASCREAAVAAAALGRLRASDATDALAESLEGGGELACTAALALGEIRTGKAVAALIGALKSEDEQLAGAAAEALGRTGDERALALLVGTLKSAGPARQAARVGAARGLGWLQDKRAIPQLIDTARSDPAVEVRRSAIQAMYEVRDARIVPVMAKILRGADRNSRLYAERALSRLGTKAVVEPLKLAARTSDYTIRTECIDTLRAITGRQHPLWPPDWPTSQPARQPPR